MGNHQFGFANRPPDFLGKGWTFVKEKRRSTKERKAKSAPTLAPEPVLRRPSSMTSFLKVRYTEMHRDGSGDISDSSGTGPSFVPLTSTGGGNAGTPKSVKRTSSVKRTRSMRCSPTVPDTVTMTLGVVNNVVIGASGVAAAAAAGAVNPNAVANALDALQKLTPAAPQLGKEPSFDEFFEEAERRNQTIEVLQAALIAPSPSTASLGAQNQVSKLLERASSSNELPSPTKDIIVLLENEPVDGRPSPITVQPPTPPPSRKRSPVPVAPLSGFSLRTRENFSQATSATGTDDEEDSLLPNSGKDKDTLSAPSKGRVLIVVGGYDQESFDDERWDRPPPTIIVQPDHTLESLCLPGISSSSSSSCLTATGGSPGQGNTPRSERRRSSYNPGGSGSTSPNAPLGVRFADEVVIPTVCPERAITETVQLREASIVRRINRRSSLRRKTIGGITSCAADGTGVAVGEAAVTSKTMDDATASAGSTTTASSQQQRSPSRPFAKKSLSRSDMTQPPSIISLLTQPQINLIRQLWLQIYATKGPIVLGSHIFQRVVFKNPNVREVFRTVDIGNQCFNVDVMCKAHAKVVAAILDDVVRNLDNLEAVEAKLMEVGRQHAVFHDLGFHLNFWSVFAEAFIDCTLEWGEKNRRVEEARKAWAIIIAYITDKMKLGYQEARRNLPRGCSTGRRIRVSETEPATAVLTLPLVRSDSH